MRNVNRLRREEILSLHAGRTHVMLASASASLVLACVFLLCFLVLKNGRLDGRSLVSAAFLLVWLLPSGYFLKREFELQARKGLSFKPPFLYIWALAAAALLFLFNLPPGEVFLRLSDTLVFMKFTARFYGLAFIFAFTAGTVLYGAAKACFYAFLQAFSRIDCSLVQERGEFDGLLVQKFQDVKRYGGNLSLVTVGFRGGSGPGDDLSRKRRTTLKILELLGAHLRKTDVIGNFEDGTIAGVLSHTDAAGALVAAGRVLEFLKGSRDFQGPGSTVFKCGISRFDEVMKEPGEMVRDALFALNSAFNSPDRDIVVFERKQ